MNFRQRLAAFASDRGTVLTVGVFDGVHQGHRHLLRRLVQLGGTSHLPAVLTFSNHPITVLRPGTRVGYITPPEERVQLLKDQGIELVICLDFTEELSQVSARDFTRMLVDLLHMKGLVMGPDSALGRDRQGDVDFLRRQGTELGFWVEVVEPFRLDGEQVNSRRIRASLAEGDVATCARLLGRKFRLEGLVVKGDRKGQELGFPTANLEVDARMVLPGDGIYATWVTIGGVRRPSATSIGVRPTFGLTERLVEVHVMDFSGELYGKRLGVEFVVKLRDQEAFPSVEDLIDQIGRDVGDCRRVLAQDREAAGA